MSLILNIETAIDICSVALSNGKDLVDFRLNSEGKSHASLLTVFIEDLLKQNNINISQLSAVSVSMGPGSYTGLRIGVSAAKGICYGASIPLISVNTMQIMVNAYINKHIFSAETTDDDVLLCPMIDARRLEVYTALYNKQGSEILPTQALIIDENSFKEELERTKIYFFGNGAEKCSLILKHKNAIFVKDIYPTAMDMINYSSQLFEMKQFQDVAYFEPFYLKDFIATVPKNKILPKF